MKSYCMSCGHASIGKPNFCEACGEKFKAYHTDNPKKIKTARRIEEDEDEGGDELKTDDEWEDEEEIEDTRKPTKSKSSVGVEIEYGQVRGTPLMNLAQGIKSDPNERRPIVTLTEAQKKALAQSVLNEGASIRVNKKS